jgi:hypothetical protein
MPAVAHPGNDYWANILTGTIQRQSNRLFPEPLIPPVWEGPFTYTQAKQAIQASKAGFQWAGQTTPGANLVGPGEPAGAVGQAKHDISNLGGLAAIGDFFNRLTQPNTWVRVGEFAAGALLVYVGLSAAMKGTEAQQATQTVTKPVKKGVELLPPVRGAKIAASARKRVARERKVTEKAKQVRAQDRARKAASNDRSST